MVELKKFGEVCDFVRGPFGGSLKKSCFVEEGYAVYEQQHAIYDQFTKIRYFVDEDKFNEMKRFELKTNDLIMSCSGTMGKVAIVPENVKRGIINQALLKLTPKDFLDVQYLKYWMSSPDFEQRIEENTVGAAIKNVASVKVLKQIDVPIPPLPEQKQIVAILDKAFAAIDQAEANIEKNKENAKELFQSKLFAIFSQPALSGVEGKGDGWEEKVLGEIGEVQTGTTPSTKDKTNYGDYIPFAKPPHFQENGQIDTKDSMLSKTGLEKGRLFKANSTLMVCIGATIGKTGFSEKPISSNQQINGLTPNNDYVPKLLYYALISPFVQSQVLSVGKSAQATLPIINKSKWLKLKVNLPIDKSLQTQIIKTLEKLKEFCMDTESIYQQKLENLDDLKKSILQKAFAGELTSTSSVNTEKEISI